MGLRPTGSSPERASLSLNTKVLWACLSAATLLDILGVFTRLGFDPSFQLEAQPLFFAAIIFTAVAVIRRGKMGPLLAGIIFWIPIVFLGFQVVVLRQVVPFGGDLVGIAELAIAVIGVLAAHNVYHKLEGGWLSG